MKFFQQFLLVLNEKKRKIKELRDEIDTLNGDLKSENETEEPKEPLIKTKSKKSFTKTPILESKNFSLRFDDDGENNDDNDDVNKNKGLSLTQKRFLEFSLIKYFFFQSYLLVKLHNNFFKEIKSKKAV